MCCLVTKSGLTLCDPRDCSVPCFPVFHCLPQLFKLTSVESVMPSNCLILCHPLLLLPSVFPSIRVFSTSGGESIGASVSASSLLMNIQKLISFRICSSCQFPLCKYSHYYQFQAANMTSQNRELGKDAQWHPSTWYLHHTGALTSRLEILINVNRAVSQISVAHGKM